MQDLPKEVIHSARQIASRPEDHIDNPCLFTAAWAALKAARGQSFDPARLRAAHLVDRPHPAPEPTELEQMLDRIAQKTRDIAQKMGHTLPPAA